MLEFMRRRERDAKRSVEEWEGGIRERELKEKRKVAPGWLDSGVHLLMPERKKEDGGGGGRETSVWKSKRSPKQIEEAESQKTQGGERSSEGEDLDKAFGRNKEAEDLDRVFGGLGVK